MSRFSDKIVGKYMEHKERVPKICFIHVPKCGGASVSAGFRASYRLIERVKRPNFRISLPASEYASEQFGVSPFLARQIALAHALGLQQYKFATGHVFAHPDLVKKYKDSWSFVTVLRDPVSRFISNYIYNRFKHKRFYGVNEQSLDEVLNSSSGWFYGTSFCQYFGEYRDHSVPPTDEHIEQALTNLENFAAIGFLDRITLMEESFSSITVGSFSLGSYNKSPRPEMTDDIRSNREVMARIEELCEADQKIYDSVRNRLGISCEDSVDS